jgi:hypothetical protein
MRNTVVPAQITTVEDRIVGNLTFTQVLLLILPLLSSTALYVFLSPNSHISTLKFVLMLGQFALFGGLALRFKGKIVAEWIGVLTRFTGRPRTYVFTKNDPTGRKVALDQDDVDPESAITASVAPVRLGIDSLAEQLKVERLFANPKFTVSFGLAKKGKVNVSLTQVE